MLEIPPFRGDEKVISTPAAPVALATPVFKEPQTPLAVEQAGDINIDFEHKLRKIRKQRTQGETVHIFPACLNPPQSLYFHQLYILSMKMTLLLDLCLPRQNWAKVVATVCQYLNPGTLTLVLPPLPTRQLRWSGAQSQAPQLSCPDMSLAVNLISVLIQIKSSQSSKSVYGHQIVGQVPAGGVDIALIPDCGASHQSGCSQIVVPPTLSESNAPYPVHSSSKESTTITESECSFQIPPVYGQPLQSGPVIPSHISTTDKSTFELTSSTGNKDFEVPVIPSAIPHDAIPPAFKSSRPPSDISQESIIVPLPALSSSAPATPSEIAPQQPMIVVPPPAQPPRSQTPSVVFVPMPTPAPAHTPAHAPVHTPVSAPVSAPMSAPASRPASAPKVEVAVVAPTPEETKSESSAPQLIEVVAPPTEVAKSGTDMVPEVIR
ncbi:hypothetical protein FRC06_005921, partial [Ceratobasidium sp. 370]